MNGNSLDKHEPVPGPPDQAPTMEKKPLYIWAKSFDENSSKGEEESLQSFVRGNALSHALEYIGLISESEQSSLHLSAIFEEESQTSSSFSSNNKKFPNHYESETKNRIANLNRTFTELKSYFEDHFSQLVAIKPPNTVHIVSACPTCSVHELEKILLLLFGAAIKGNQKQDTIRKIKKLPADTQEALIEHIKAFSDDPQVLQLKSWSEFVGLSDEEKQKTFEKQLALIRRLLLDRNQGFQNQLMSDYFSGYMDCNQKRIYDGKTSTGSSESEFLDDPKLSAVLRQLKEELHEKTELLQDCREELEVTKSRLRELHDQLGTAQKELKSCKQARDELDALREGQEKGLRLEAELDKLKKKLQSYEQCYEQVEKLQDENRSLAIQNESLLEQNSFLTIEKESLKLLINNEPVLDLNCKLYDPDDPDENVPIEDLNVGGRHSPDIEFDSDSELLIMEEQPSLIIVKPETVEVSTSMDSCVVVEEPTKSDAGTLTVEEDFPVAKNPALLQDHEQEDDSSTVHAEKSPKRRRRRPNVRVKRTRTLLVQGQKLLPLLPKDERKAVAIKVIRLCQQGGGGASPKPKLFASKSTWLHKAAKRRKSRKQSDMENDADEELSISPNGPPNLSDIENNCSSPRNLETVCENQIFFMPCPPSPNDNLEEIFVERRNFDANEPLVSSGLYINSLQVPLDCNSRRPCSQVNFTLSEAEAGGACSCTNCCRHGDPNRPQILNVNMVENYSTHLNLNLNHIYHQQQQQQQQPYDNENNNRNRSGEFKNGGSVALGLGTTINSPQPSTTSEDDDSIWYEYGCV